MTPNSIADVHDWALAYVSSRELAYKLRPAPLPTQWPAASPPLRLSAPGRPPELTVVDKTPRSLSRRQLVNPRRRAQLVHGFFHHELQAAELMCWALLAFPQTPRAFRRGLLHIALDEVRHMGLYRDLVERLGFRLGDFPVRDWFWQRVSTCTTPLQFVALMGMGLEAGNLDHSQRFAAWFAELGDARAAAVQTLVGREEIPHVRFAVRWYRRFGGELSFDGWRRQLVAPLTPSLLRGRTLAAEARQRAGFPAPFTAALRDWR